MEPIRPYSSAPQLQKTIVLRGLQPINRHIRPSIHSGEDNFVQALPTYACLSTVHVPQYLTDYICTVLAAESRYRLRSTETADYVLPTERPKVGKSSFC